MIKQLIYLPTFYISYKSRIKTFQKLSINNYSKSTY